MGLRGERGALNAGVLAAALVGLAGIGLGVVSVVLGIVDPLGDPEPARVAATGRPAPDSVPLLDCRDGTSIGRAFDADRVFAVGVDDTGSWVAVRLPDDVTSVGWIPASFLLPEGDLSGLPVRSCDGLNGATLTATAGEVEATPPTTTSTTSTIATTTTTVPGSTTTTSTTSTTSTTTTTTTSTSSTTTSTTQPGDTEPPTLADAVVLPELIFPATCSSDTYDIFATAYLTVTDESEPLTATLSWRYLPTDEYDFSGTLPVSVEPGTSGTQLVGAVSDLPDPYPPPISGPPPTPVIIEFEWVVADAAGNVSGVTSTADLGRCL